jgi:acyl-CoA thioesterase FadM
MYLRAVHIPESVKVETRLTELRKEQLNRGVSSVVANLCIRCSGDELLFSPEACIRCISTREDTMQI